MIRIFSILPVQLLNKMMTFRYTYVLTYLSIWLLYIILVRIHFREMQGTESRIKIMCKWILDWMLIGGEKNVGLVFKKFTFICNSICTWSMPESYYTISTQCTIYFVLKVINYTYYLYSPTVLGQDAVVVVVSHHNLSLKLETLEPKQII